MRQFTTGFVVLLLVMFAFTSVQSLDQKNLELQTLTSATDAAPNIGPVAKSNPADEMWDLLFTTNVGSTVNDNQILGGEFAQDWFFVTGGNSATDPNQVYKLDRDGNLIDQFDQWESVSWGWRDLVYDGTYLYGSDDLVISAFDLYGEPMHDFDIDSPIHPARALAYDPVTDHFWTQSFGGPLYEFDRDGNIAWTGISGATGVYGAAWDDAAPDGPWLWLFDQTGNTFHQYDPLNHVMTGFIYSVPVGGTAGGAFFTNEFDPGFWTMGGIGQSSDLLFVLEMYPNAVPQFDVSLVPVIQPIQIPASGGSFDFYAFVGNNETYNVEVGAWVEYIDPLGMTSDPLMGPATINLEASATTGWFRTQNVAGTAMAGVYEYVANLGIYPDDVWYSDSFEFEKMTTGDGLWVDNWDNYGDPFGIEEIAVTEAVPMEYALHAAYPNPFNPTSTISYALPQAGKVSLTVYDLQGRMVTELVNGYRDASVHEAIFDGTGLASGVYLYKLQANDFSANGKMIMMK